MPTRTVRQEILTSERVDLLSMGAELFYRRLMSVADDFGRYHANPKLLISACYPLRVDSVSAPDIDGWLSECSAADLISVYEADNKRFLVIHQFNQRYRAKSSKFPDPPDGSKDNTHEKKPESAHDGHVTDMRPARAYVDVIEGADEDRGRETKTADAAPARSRQHGDSKSWNKISDADVRKVVQNNDLQAFLRWDREGIAAFGWMDSEVARINRAAFWHRAVKKKLQGKPIRSPAAFLVSRMKDADVRLLQDSDYDWARRFIRCRNVPPSPEVIRNVRSPTVERAATPADQVARLHQMFGKVS